jgi:hypothetical protein
MARLAAALAALALALAPAACGGGEDDGSSEFREGYNRALTRLTRVSGDVGQEGPGNRTNRQVAGELEGFARTWDRARADLSRLRPPAGARDEFDALLAALEDGITDLRTAAKAARSDDPEAFAKAKRSLAASGGEIAEAERRLKAALGP